MKIIKKLPPNRKGSVIRCECGFEILVIPDAEAVGISIDAHIEEHKRKHKDPVEAEKTAQHIHDFLFAVLFEKIAEE